MHQKCFRRAASRPVVGVFAAALALFAAAGPGPVPAQAKASDSTALAQGGLTIKWLGNAGWEMRIGPTVILVDPFMTRKDAVRGQEWKTDEAAVLDVVKEAHYIFVGHSHVDHVSDVPFIARRFGSKVVGSLTTTNLAITGGVDRSQLITVGGGETLEFEGFSVRVIESVHDVLAGSRPGPVRTIDQPLPRPMRGEDFVDGGTYLYSFTFGSQRVLHQSSGNFLVERLVGLQPDVVLMSPNHDDYDLRRALEALNPRAVVPHHFDEWRMPFAQGITESNLGRTRRFTSDVRAINSQIRVTVPRFFDVFTLDALVGRPPQAVPTATPWVSEEGRPAAPQPGASDSPENSEPPGQEAD